VTTKKHQIEVSGIPVEIKRKKIRNLHLGVYPPEGRVRVSAPLFIDDEAIRLAVISRLKWIKKQQKKFLEQDRQSEREMITGETHFFRGRRYRLDVIEADQPPRVCLRGTATMELRVRPGTNRKRREEILYEWYRRQLKEQIPPLIAKWEEKIGVSVLAWGVKRMKTRWGSCNVDARRIWLNLELVKRHPLCLEYIIVHEMVHLLEKRHNERFRELMDGFMPGWRHHKEGLKEIPLTEEYWEE